MKEKGRVRRGTPEWDEAARAVQGRSGAADGSPKGAGRGQPRGGAQRDLGDDAAVILERAGLGQFMRKGNGNRYELIFHPKRRWRYDLTYQEQFLNSEGERVAMGSGGVVVDVDGGMATTGMAWGDHVNPDGYDNDRTKDAEAQILGYIVVRVSKRMMNDVEGEWGMVALVRRALRARGMI